MAPARFEVAPATGQRWADVEQVFAGRGDPGRCWCQWFFDGAVVGPAGAAAANRDALRAQVAAGPPPGVLGYADGVPVGWCAVGPRRCYGRLARSQVLRGQPADEFRDPAVWAITCFVVRAPARRQGVAAGLLGGAVEFAAANGAAVIEAYPVDTAVRSATPASVLYHGVLSIFVRAGFTEVRRPRQDRPVVRRHLRR